MLKIKTMIPVIILFLAVLPAFAQDIDISDAPGGMSRGATISNANASYWLAWFIRYSVNSDSLSKRETSIALNQLFQIFWKGSRDTSKHLSEGGVATAAAGYLKRDTLMTNFKDRQFAIFVIIYVGLCDPVNIPISTLLPILKNIELKNGDGHRYIFRTLGKKSDSLLIASLCDIIIHPENYPGKDTCIREFYHWGEGDMKRITMTAIAAEFLKPLTKARVHPALLNQYLQARFIAFGEAYTPVPQWKIIAMIKALEPPTTYFDVQGRKVLFNRAPGRFHVCRQVGLRAIIIH